MLLIVNATSGAAWCCWWLCSRAVWKVVGPRQKIPDGALKYQQALGSCVLFRASCKLVPWVALFQNLTKIN